MAFDLDQLRKFRYERTGLLDPNGNLVVVPLYGHFEALKKYDIFHDRIEEFQNLVSQVAEDHAYGVPEGEHPEWHIFEAWQSSEENKLRTELINYAYKQGWGRIGYINNHHEPMLELETNKETAGRLTKAARELAEMLDAELMITVVDKLPKR